MAHDQQDLRAAMEEPLTPPSPVAENFHHFPPRTPFGEEEIQEVISALRSQNLFSFDGTKVKDLEKNFAELYGVSHALSATSGTAAIHMAIAALDLEPGSEIITSPVTDFGTIAGMLFQGCIPIFADWKPGTFLIDPEDVERKISDKTAAILPVHLFGNPCDMDAIMEIAKRHGLPVIEDCAQAYCTRYRGQLAGTIGDIGCFSMQQSKHLTAGEGGIVITNNPDYAMRLELFRDKGWESRGKWGARAYAFLGLNYRMNEQTAAIALAQLKKVERVVATRRRMGERFTQQLSSIPGVLTPPTTEGGEHSFWRYALRIPGGSAEAVTRRLLERGVPCGWGYTVKPIYLCTEALMGKHTFGTSGYPFDSPYYGKQIEYKPGLCPVAEKELLETIDIRWHEDWTMDDVDAAAEIVADAMKEIC